MLRGGESRKISKETGNEGIRKHRKRAKAETDAQIGKMKMAVKQHIHQIERRANQRSASAAKMWREKWSARKPRYVACNFAHKKEKKHGAASAAIMKRLMEMKAKWRWRRHPRKKAIVRSCESRAKTASAKAS